MSLTALLISVSTSTSLYIFDGDDATLDRVAAGLLLLATVTLCAYHLLTPRGRASITTVAGAPTSARGRVAAAVSGAAIAAVVLAVWIGLDLPYWFGVLVLFPVGGAVMFVIDKTVLRLSRHQVVAGPDAPSRPLEHDPRGTP
ncbi:hypothetical protein INN71_02235 [Nocardioides sp. ChNu-153]|uniref:hypothetical protein n=1 Tax=unclassified Nocardioides TaxID=2615069 RepID=UPI002406C63D|nr:MULTISPECIES: hypothetical protein [unclassified Nocardioides]MDF9716817.1 hypothetical protein [Nocardioides sp. ChNu-99]MDN7120203.1 hypothetical protein [Nocardioides sp. ChNu-153]